ncbi:MAG: hypothetical protein ACLQPH_08580 [Acidimicrobiales bacterium]
MTDVVLLATIVAFFIVAALLVRFCATITAETDADTAQTDADVDGESGGVDDATRSREDGRAGTTG